MSFTRDNKNLSGGFSRMRIFSCVSSTTDGLGGETVYLTFEPPNLRGALFVSVILNVVDQGLILRVACCENEMSSGELITAGFSGIG